MTKIFHTPELHKEIWKDIIGFEGLYQISNYDGLTYSYLASMLNGNKVNKTSLNYL